MTNDTSIKASREVVEALTVHLEKALGEYTKEHPEATFADVFMAAHSFHKLVVRGIAVAWGAEIPPAKTYEMADVTFRKAIRDLKRK